MTLETIRVIQILLIKSFNVPRLGKVLYKYHETEYSQENFMKWAYPFHRFGNKGSEKLTNLHMVWGREILGSSDFKGSPFS